MKCTITFTVAGNDPIKLDLETDQASPVIDDDIKRVLETNKVELEKLCAQLEKKLSSFGIIEKINTEKIEEGNLIGNCGIEFLRSKFPKVKFPEGVEANVLLLNNLQPLASDTPISKGRIIQPNGQELFIISGQESNNKIGPPDVIKLANYLIVRQQIEDSSFIFSETSEYYKTLQKCLEARNKRKTKVKNIEDMILDFINNKSEYATLYFKDDNDTQQNVYNTLQKISNIILKYSDRKTYNDPVVNIINQHIKHTDKNTKEMDLDALYAAIKTHYDDSILKPLNIRKKEQFKNFFSQNENQIHEPLKKVFGETVEGVGYNTLFKFIFDKEPTTPLSFNSVKGNKVIFNSKQKTIFEKYEIGYDTISKFTIVVEDYKGYKIYKQSEKEYYLSRGYLTENSYSNKYESIEDVKKSIDDKIENQDIRTNNFIDFKLKRCITDNDGNRIYADNLDNSTIYTNQSFTPGSIIEVIDVPLNAKTKFYNGEYNLFDYRMKNVTIINFRNIVNSWNEVSENLKNTIIKQIDTPEKVTIFIYKLNELFGYVRNDESIQEILNIIETAPKKFYYIDSKNKSTQRGKFRYSIILTDKNTVEEYKQNKRIPILKLMEAIQTVLGNKGVNVNMLTSNEIQEKFPDIDVNTDRAFIKDGEIYINTTIAKSSDLLHEYTHLILGLLKIDRNLRGNYENLLNYVVSTSKGKELFKSLKDIYTESSEMDIREEVFVKLFSSYVMRNLDPEVKQIFKANKKFLEEATSSIFDTNTEEIYAKSLEEAFMRFNSEVYALLSDSSNEINFNETKTSRKYSNWISKQIQEYNTTNKNGIKENCNG